MTKCSCCLCSVLALAAVFLYHSYYFVIVMFSEKWHHPKLENKNCKNGRKKTNVEKMCFQFSRKTDRQYCSQHFYTIEAVCSKEPEEKNFSYFFLYFKTFVSFFTDYSSSGQKIYSKPNFIQYVIKTDQSVE